jgi:hypothetical protein
MPNVLLTPQLLTKLTLANLGGPLHVAAAMNTDYAKTFAKKGNKQGDTFTIRKPQRFVVSKGLAYQPQPLSDTTTTVKVDQVAQVAFEFDSVERTLSLDFIQERYAKPAAIALANNINKEAAAFIAQNTFNAVGTPGTVPNTMLTYLNAGDKLVQLGMPENQTLAMVINRKMSSTYVDANKALYNAQSVISGQMKNGKVADTLGYDWMIDQTIYTHTVGALGGTPLVNGAQSNEGGNNGTIALSTKGWTSAAAARLKQGDNFTIANVYSVHPQTRVSTGDLQQFVVLLDFSSDGSGNGSVTVAPAITPSGQYQNVDAGAIDGAAITVLGAATVQSPTGLLLHRDAFAFLSVPMENPEPSGVEMVSQETDPETGATLAFIRAFDPVRRVHVNRFDMLYGFGVLYRELACRVQS